MSADVSREARDAADAPGRYDGLFLAAGAVFLLLGIAIGWISYRHRGEDLGYVYLLAQAVVHGRNAYDADVQQQLARQYLDFVPSARMYYPPSSGVLFLALLPVRFGIAKFLFFWLMTGALIGGLWTAMAVFLRETPPARRFLVLGLLMCCSANRWGFQLLQAAPLILGLLGLYMAALHRGRTGLAGVLLTVVVLLKVTLALPFIGLALLKKRWQLVAAALFCFAVINVALFARMGGMTAYQDYSRSIAQQDMPGQHDYIDPRLPTSLPRLDWSSLLAAVGTPVKAAKAAGALLSIGSLLYLVVLGRRSKRFADDGALQAAFVGPLTGLGLLCVYHHHYDSNLLLLPVVLSLGMPALRRLPGVKLFAVVVLFYDGLYPVSQAQNLAGRLMGSSPHAWDVIVALKMLGSVCVTAAFAASLFALATYVRGKASAGNGGPLSAE